MNRPGRPRDEAAEQAILQAVVSLLGEQGFTNLTMGEVARRAGVGKPTVYRRWGSKAELVVDAIARHAPPLPARRSGDPSVDLHRLIRATINNLTRPPLGTTIITLLAEARTEPELLSLVQDRLAGPRRGVVLEVLQQAVDGGQLRPGTDPQLTLDLLLGTLLYRWLITGKELSRAAIDEVVDTVWAAYATT